MNRRHSARHYLRVITANVCSLRGKKATLEHLLGEHDPDVVCLQETLTAHKLVLREYEERDFTPPTNGGRGTKLLVRKSLCSTKVDCSAWNTHGVEMSGVNIHIPGEAPIGVINTYLGHRIPATDRRGVMQNLVSAVSAPVRTMAVGDHNAKLDVIQHLTTNPLGDAMEEFVESEELVAILPDDYTRYDPAGRSPSTIDFAVTTPQNQNMVESLMVLPDIGSDHRPVLFKIPLKSNPHPPIITHKPNLGKADWDAFQSSIIAEMREAPPIIHTRESLERAAKFMAEIIKKVDSQTIPRIRMKSGPRKRELPQYIVDLIYAKRNLRNVKQKRGRNDLNPEINRLDRLIQDLITTFEYERKCEEWEACQNKDRHGFFKLAGRILKSSVGTTAYPIKDQDGETPVKDDDKLEEFSNLYEDIYTPSAETEESRPGGVLADRYYSDLAEEYSEVRRRPRSQVLDQTVTPEKIRRVLAKTKNTAPGGDGIYYTHLKHLPEEALQYLALLYQTCWECAYFPTVWKNAVVALQPKPGKDHTVPKNYRPISLLSALGKVYERLINAELVAHLERFGTFPECQAGFRAKRSTQDHLLKFSQDAIETINKGFVLMATFFDVEKAFDKMWHQGFLLKLSKQGLDRQSIALFQNYLQGRTIQIRIYGKCGRKVPLRAGTPQGAILSPTLFNVYVCDIPLPTLDVKVSQFADDIGSWATGKMTFQARDSLQTYNDRLLKWCKTWRIVLAPTKTQLLTVSKKKNRYERNICYQMIDGHRVETSETAEFLGVIFDSGLTMNTHANKILQSLRQRVGYFRKITGSHVKPVASTEVCLKILHSMIVSQATYGAVATCVMTKNKCDQIDSLLRKAARLALHAPPSTRSEYIIKEAGLEPIQSLLVKLGRNYINNPNRSVSVKMLVEGFRNRPARHRQGIPTPLHLLK